MMPHIGWSELLMVAIVALVVVGPRDLPRVMRAVGLVVRRGRAVMHELRGGFDHLLREAELEEVAREVKKSWGLDGDTSETLEDLLDPGQRIAGDLAQDMSLDDVPRPAVDAAQSAPLERKAQAPEVRQSSEMSSHAGDLAPGVSLDEVPKPAADVAQSAPLERKAQASEVRQSSEMSSHAGDLAPGVSLDDVPKPAADAAQSAPLERKAQAPEVRQSSEMSSHAALETAEESLTPRSSAQGSSAQGSSAQVLPSAEAMLPGTAPMPLPEPPRPKGSE